MTISILLFGGLILLAGLFLLHNPEIVFGFLRSNSEHIVIHIMAVVVRLVVGIFLIIQSNLSRFPSTIEVLGWIFIFSAIGLTVIGRNRFRKLLSWVLVSFKGLARIAGLFAVAFGGFLVYAFV